MTKFKVDYSATGNTGAPDEISWLFNGAVIEGESSGTLNRPDITNAAGYVQPSVKITDAKGRKRTKFGNKITTLNTLPTIDTLTKPQLTKGSGSTINIVIGTYSDSPTVTRTYYLNGVATGGISPPTYSLAPGDTLYFVEVATKPGYVTATETSNVVTGSATAPSAFTDGSWFVEDANEDGSLRFSFSGLPDDGGSPLTDVYLYQDGSTTPISTGITEPGVFYILSGLTADQLYSYTVAAVNAIDVGPQSSPLEATPINNTSAVTVANQIADFGELTKAGAGGFKLVDTSGGLVDITSVTPISGMGSYVASISSGNALPSLNGRMKFNLAGCPDGAVIDCGWSGGTARVTIRSEPLTYHVASAAEYTAAMTAAHPAGGKTIKFRRGDVDSSDSVKPTDKNYTSEMVITCEVSPPARFAEGSLTTRLIGGLSFNTCSNIAVVGLDLYEPAGGATIGFTGTCRNFRFYRNEIHGKPIALDASDKTTTGQAYGFQCGSASGRPAGFSGIIRENLIHDVGFIAKPLSFSQPDPVLIEDNECYRYIGDGWKYGCSGEGLAASKIFRRNVHYWFMGVPGVHGDCFAQCAGNGGLAIQSMQFVQNVAFPGSPYADNNGQALTSFADGSFAQSIHENVVVVGNVMIAGGNYNIYMEINGGVVRNNLTLGPNGTALSGSAIRNVGLATVPGVSVLPVKLENNIGEAVYAPVNGGTDTNNLRTGGSPGGSTAAYAAAIVGAANMPVLSWSEAKANLATLDPSRGAFGATGLTYGNPRDPGSWYCDPALLV